MIGLDRMLLRDILDSKMARISKDINSKDLVSMISYAVTEAIVKNNDQIERDISTTETDEHCCM